MSFSQGEHICNIHGGDLAVPESDEETKKILDPKHWQNTEFGSGSPLSRPRLSV